MAKTVVVDGISYVPAAEQRPQFGVAVTTHNRNHILGETLAALDKYTPDGTPIVVVDDGSKQPVAVDNPRITLVRHQQPQGIPAAKNRCLEELMRLGVDHMFLFDDDTTPAAEDWWQPYIESPEPHLQYCWTHFANGQAVPNMDVLHQDSRHTAYGWSMGCMLYVDRRAVDRVGGMRLDFGQGMEEHVEWSRRIWNAGLTTYVHQDITGSRGLFNAADETQSVKRSFTTADRQALMERNVALREKYWGTTDYIEYRKPRDAILTCYLTGRMDPQRTTIWKPDAKAVAPLLDSLAKTGVTPTIVVDHSDFNSTLGSRCEIYLTESAHEAYRQRWVSYYQYLLGHKEIRYCWFVDATDVRMLNNPFPSMRPRTLYVGWEPKTVGCQWMRKHGRAIEEWIDANSHRMLVNAGVIGGDRPTLMRLCRAMIDMWYIHRADTMHEMPFFNHVVYQHFPHHVTGPQVATVFRQNVQSDDTAFWAHK